MHDVIDTATGEIYGSYKTPDGRELRDVRSL